MFRNYTTIENAADGNCLFHSIAQQDARYSHTQLRKLLGAFYETIDPVSDSDTDSDSDADDSNQNANVTLLWKLRMQMKADNIEYTPSGRVSTIPHTKKIRKANVYAGIMDVIAMAHILQRPIIVVQPTEFRAPGAGSAGSGADPANDEYQINEFTDDNVRSAAPIYVKFNGNDHFEAFVPRRKDSDPSARIGINAELAEQYSTMLSKPRPSPDSAAEVGEFVSPNNSPNSTNSQFVPPISPTLRYRALHNQLMYDNDLTQIDRVFITQQMTAIKRDHDHVEVVKYPRRKYA